MMRKSELTENINQSKPFTGVGFFFAGMTVSIALFDPMVAICAQLHLILGDLSAALVGIAIGQIKIWGKKSLEGFLAMVVCCASISAVFFLDPSQLQPQHQQTNAGIAVVIASSICASTMELLNPDWIDDNLTIPLASGFAITGVLSQWK